mmetsp:Transcript_62955/g.149991  ORF Transcript_62955/g.149991 Transcript_62955/m.149991 type:complete len:272 (+) Transcript_62955:66-881(+)
MDSMLASSSSRNACRQAASRSARRQRCVRGYAAALSAVVLAAAALRQSILAAEAGDAGSSQQAFAVPRRQAILAASLASAGAVANVAVPAAEAEPIAGKIKIDEAKVLDVPYNPKSGARGYSFLKPAGFRRLANVVDPTAYLFKNADNGEFQFVARADKLAEGKSWSVQTFVDDYSKMFVSSTGSSFAVLKGGGPPDRVVGDVEYYEVEYIVRTQTGFTFDSLKTLHFLTVFAKTSDGYVHTLNMQARDDDWETAAPILREVAASYTLAVK